MSELKQLRRSTVAQEAEESLINGAQTINKKKKKSFKQILTDIGSSIYNKEYREFLTRDSKAWFKLSLFYFIFYLLLSGFFVILVLILYAIIDLKEPTYYNKNSVMNSRQPVNPGMGFRPQPDPESELISYSVNDYKKYFNSLDQFLQSYDQNKETNFTGAHGTKITYNIDEILKDSPCSKENFYGYNTPSPCVVVKLNKIFSWLPKVGPSPPGYNLTKVEDKKYFVYVACNGETSVDKDNIDQIEYYSTYPNHEIGGIDFKYFPYRNQPGYLAPLVFVHFKKIEPFTLINVECKAYAKNIDNQDRQNRRGMVKFQLFVRT
jgi:sodium/potassium-transporting ATPase subunit beta